MPLDPTLANGFAPLKLDDPMDQMGKVLTNAMMMDKMSDGSAKRRKAKAYNELYAQFAKPDGSVDWDGMEYKAAQTGLGDIIPDIKDDRLKWDKGRAEIGAAEAKTKGDIASTTKTKTESQSKFDENYATMLAGVSNFEQLKSRVIQAYNNDIAHSVYGGVENAKAAAKNELMEAQAAEAKGPNEFAKWIARRVVGKDSFKHSYQLVGEKDKQTLLATNDYGTPGAAPVKTFGAKPERKGVTINNNMPGQPAVDSFGDTFGKNEANDLSAIKEAANTAPNVLRDVNKIRGQLKKAFTGKAAGAITDIVAWGKAAGLNVPNDRLIASQVVRKYLKDNIFSLIAKHKMEGASVTPFSNVDMKITEDSSANQELDVAAINKLMDDLEDAAYESADKYGRTYDTVMSGPRISPTVKALMTQKVVMPPRQYRDDEGDVIGEQFIQRLRKSPGSAAAFDREVGVPGLAAKILRNQGGTSTQAAPFNR